MRKIKHSMTCAGLLAAAGLSITPTVHAAEVHWTTSSSIISNGNGTWNSTGNNWRTAIQVTGSNAWNNSGADSATFGSGLTSGGFTVTLGSNITTSGLSFVGLSTYTIAGQAGTTLTLTGTAPTFTVSAENAIITANLVANAGATKTGTGTLTLSGNNAFNQGLTINNGVVDFSSGALGSSGNIMLSGGELRWSVGNTQDISSRISIANGESAKINVGANNVTFANSFQGGSTGGLTKTGSGTLTLAASNSFTGAVNLNEGVLALNAAGAIGWGDASTYGSIRFNGGTLRFSAANTTDYSARFFSGADMYRIDSGGAAITFNQKFATMIGSELFKYGEGSLRITEQQIGLATTNIHGGSLILSGSGSLGGSIVKIDSGAELRLEKGAYTFDNVIQRSGKLTVAAGNGQVTRIIGANIDFEGTLSLVSGIAELGNISAISTSKIAAIEFKGGTLKYSVLTNGLDHSAKFSGEAGSAYAMDTAGYNVSYASTFGGATGNGNTLSKHGEGTLSLAATTTYTGATTVNAGTLAFTDGTHATSAIAVAGGANLAFTGANNVTINAAISGTGTLSKSGAGITTLSGPVTTTGTVSISEGTLALNGTATLGTGAVTLNGATLRVEGANSVTIGNNISGSGAIRRTGTGVARLTGSSSGYNGAITVESGTLLVNGIVGWESTTTVQAGGALGGNFGGAGYGRAITVQTGGILTPGVDGDAGIGTLHVRTLALAGGSVVKMNLGASGTADAIVATGAITFTGTGNITLDLLGTGSGSALAPSTYTLISGATNTIAASRYTVTNLAEGLTGSVALSGNDLVLTVIPEPAEYAVGMAGAAALVAGIRRRRRATPERV